MRKLILLVILLSIIKVQINAQNQSVKTAADIAWETEMPKPDPKANDIRTVEGVKAFEMYCRAYFESGAKLCKQFPDDERVIRWLDAQGYFFPGCWKNIEEGAKAKAEKLSKGNEYYSTAIDWDLLNRYEKERVEIRNAVLNDATVSHETKNKVRNELSRILYNSLNTQYVKSKASFLNELKNAFDLAISGIIPTDKLSKDDLRQCVSIFRNGSSYGFTNDDYATFLHSYVNSDKLQVREWATKQATIFKHKKEPFELIHHTIDGEEIDLSKMRDKIVLIDFWSTGCADCIARMPAVKKVYDKYKSKGFIVISIALNPEVDKEKVLKIHEKIGADWPVMLIGGDARPGHIASNSMGKLIFDKYGFNGVPQLILLDKQGKLVMYNDLLTNGDFEPLIKKLISE